MELRQLEYFVELCKTRNFTRAAVHLHVAQPSVTKAVQQLEEELGVRLIERGQKPVGLTRAGEHFLDKIQVALQLIREAADEAASRAEHKVIRFGLSPFSGALLEELLTAPADGHGALFCNIIRRSSVEILERLQCRELDLGWILFEKECPGLDFIPVELQRVVLAIPEGHPLCCRESVRFEELRNIGLTQLGTEKNSVLARIVAERCKEAGFTPKDPAEGSQFHPDRSMALNWVRMGLGPRLLPEHAAAGEDGICLIPLDPPLLVQAGLAFRSGSDSVREIRRFIDIILQEYPKLL